MGTLTPNATYVYESDGTRIYAREFGKNERKVIGYTHGAQAREERKAYMNQMNEILTMCETDESMKLLLDQLIMLYNLKRTYE